MLDNTELLPRSEQGVARPPMPTDPARPPPTVSVNAETLAALVNLIAEQRAQRTPEQRQQMTAAIMTILSALMKVLPQLSVAGLGLQTLLTIFGAMGPPLATSVPATTTGQGTLTTLLTTLAIGLLNRRKPPQEGPK